MKEDLKVIKLTIIKKLSFDINNINYPKTNILPLNETSQYSKL